MITALACVGSFVFIFGANALLDAHDRRRQAKRDKRHSEIRV